MKAFRKAIYAAALLLSCLVGRAQTNETPKIVRSSNGHPTLLVDGKPYMILGGQCGNSSNWPATLPNVWNIMKNLNANTLEVPIYWEEIEPVRGSYDLSSVQLLLDQARENDMRLVLLWFATWKNGSNHYMPEWMKLDYRKYYNVTAKDGSAVDSPSPHCEAAMELDAKAFTQVMKYLKENDPQHTVIMVQVQNEPGTWGSVRDYSKEADKLFAKKVPAKLLKDDVLKELGVAPGTRGSWSEVFGDRADEYFHAWHIASYIEYVASAGKKVNDLPLYVNAALRNPLTDPMANSYESGGPTDNVISIYKAAAPSIDIVAPDIYESEDAKISAIIRLYDRPDNALFVPENGGRNKFLYEVLSRGIGFAPFGVDNGDPSRHDALAADYRLLRPIAGQLAAWAAEGRLHSAYEPVENRVQRVDLGEWEAVLTFGKALKTNDIPEGIIAGSEAPAAGKILIVKLDEGDFLVVGNDVRCSFRPLGKKEGRPWHFLRVEEGEYDADGNWVMRRVLNGDETDWKGPHIGSSPKMLRIRTYAR